MENVAASLRIVRSDRWIVVCRREFGEDFVRVWRDVGIVETFANRDELALCLGKFPLSAVTRSQATLQVFKPVFNRCRPFLVGIENALKHVVPQRSICLKLRLIKELVRRRFVRKS